MDQATIEKMFDPFFTTKFTGRGLGMSAILGIVRGHHGAISVDSRPGEGTTFRIMLPVGQSARRPSAASAEPLAQPDGCRGTVLVVDDEPFIREVVCAMLADLGFDVLQAEDGEQAIERYRAHPGRIAVVLLDMTMPKMDGKHCLAELKRIDPDVRVLLSSGYSVEEVSELFADQSPAGFIQKPYLPESLQRHIAAILGQQY
jgi:CheY-like chemotaxis protein